MNQYAENVESWWDYDRHVNRFKIHLIIGHCQVFVGGYVANTLKDIRIESVNNATIGDSITVLAYIASRKDWYIRTIIDIANTDKDKSNESS